MINNNICWGWNGKEITEPHLDTAVNFLILFWWKFDNGPTWSGRISDILRWFWVLLVLLLFTTAIYQRGAMELKCATSSDTSYLSSKRSFAQKKCLRKTMPDKKLRLTQITCLLKDVSPKKKYLRKTMLDKKKLRLTQVTCHQKDILLFTCLWKWGEVELLRVEAIKAKWFNSPPNFYLNAPTQFFAANVPNKDLEVSHLRQKPHQDLWGHISGGEDQSWKPPLTNSWAFLPPVRNWGSCQDLVLPLHPLGAQRTATTIGVE